MTLLEPGHYSRMAKINPQEKKTLTPVKSEEPERKRHIDIEEGLQQLLNQKYVQCDKCNGILQFKGRGAYECRKCGNLIYDDFGKVAHYLDSHGPSSKSEIAKATGVKESVVADFLKDQRLEVVKTIKF